MTGVYRNNFPIMGFFGETIRFISNDSFQYVFQGDLIHDSTVGRYQIYNNKIFVLYKALPDSIYGHSRFNTKVLVKITSTDTIRYQQFWFIGHNKLYNSYDSTGKKIVVAQGYFRKKKYFLFGSHYYDKQYFLKRIN